MEIFEAKTAADYAEARALFIEYADGLGIDLCFQGFDEELASLHAVYAPPRGIILLAKINGAYAGCIAVRPKSSGIAELKRMYVRPEFRRQSLAEKLLDAALGFARDAGYEKIRLDTLASMLPAISLYKKYGFYEIEPYYFNPEKNAVFFEKTF